MRERRRTIERSILAVPGGVVGTATACDASAFPLRVASSWGVQQGNESDVIAIVGQMNGKRVGFGTLGLPPSKGIRKWRPPRTDPRIMRGHVLPPCRRPVEIILGVVVIVVAVSAEYLKRRSWRRKECGSRAGLRRRLRCRGILDGSWRKEANQSPEGKILASGSRIRHMTFQTFSMRLACGLRTAVYVHCILWHLSGSGSEGPYAFGVAIQLSRLQKCDLCIQ